MMRAWATAVIAGVVLAGLTVSSPTAWADPNTANPATFSVDCDNQAEFNTSLGSINWPGSAKAIAAKVGQTFTIQNSGTSGACTLSSGDGTSLVAAAATIAANSPLEVTVSQNGPFTITPAGGAAETFSVHVCSLDGSGTADDPFLVADATHFAAVGLERTTVGTVSCVRWGHYKQTANIAATTRVTEQFTGVYDGDHFTLSRRNSSYEDTGSLFEMVTGVIQRLRVTGSLRTETLGGIGGVVGLLTGGGVVSEIDSRIEIIVSNRAIAGANGDVLTDTNDLDRDGDNNDGVELIVGGIVRFMDVDASSNARIQYSRFAGTITHCDNDEAQCVMVDSGDPVFQFGGLVGRLSSGGGIVEIRDSYSVGTINTNTTTIFDKEFNSATDGSLEGKPGDDPVFAMPQEFDTVNKNTTAVPPESVGAGAGTWNGTPAATANLSRPEFYVGGLVGFADVAPLLVRTYSQLSAGDECDQLLQSCLNADDSNGIGGEVGDPDNQTRWLGTLIGGVLDGVDTSGVISNFFKSIDANWYSRSKYKGTRGDLAFGAVRGSDPSAPESNDLPADYLANSGDAALAPTAVELSSQEFATLNSFTTRENPESGGNPGGEEIPYGTAILNDYRWAITSEIKTFVPSAYSSSTNAVTTFANSGTVEINDYTGTIMDDYTQRVLYSSNSIAATYPRTADILDGVQTTVFTPLGKVWEMCPGQSAPTLVWEQETCEGTGGDTSNREDDDAGEAQTAAALASSLGLSEAEYAEFLASGLTLEQFKAQRLAATGSPFDAMIFGIGTAFVLLSVGLSMMMTSRKQRAQRL